MKGKRIVNSGMVLLEVVVATAILGIALISLAVAIGRCVSGMSAANHLQVALDVAEYRLKEWKTGNSEEGEIRPGVFEGQKLMGIQKINWRQEIEPTDDPNVLKSTLIIRWKDGLTDQQRSFFSFVSKSSKKEK